VTYINRMRIYLYSAQCKVSNLRLPNQHSVKDWCCSEPQMAWRDLYLSCTVYAPEAPQLVQVGPCLEFAVQAPYQRQGSTPDSMPCSLTVNGGL
jgi:hypothetical protein